MKKLLTLALAFAAFGSVTAKANSYPEKTRTIPAGPKQKPFDVTHHSISLNEIKSGGPPKDGIPALFNPRFVSAQEGDKFLIAWDRVLGIEHKGVAKAYPIKILNWHEVVNDTIGKTPVVVSW